MRLGNQRVTVIFYVHIMKLTLWYPSHPFISLSFLLGLLHILLDPFHIPICVTAIHSRAVSSAEMRHKFYSQLDSAIQQVSNNEYLMLLVNFTARTGSDQEPLPMSWPLKSKKDQWKRSSSSRAVHIPETVLYQYTLRHRHASQGYIIDPNTDTSWIS